MCSKRMQPYKAILFLYQKGRCAYCEKGMELRFDHVDIPHGSSIATLDHIKPKCQGGGNTWDNLILACQFCNNTKSDKPVKPRINPLKVKGEFLIENNGKVFINLRDKDSIVYKVKKYGQIQEILA